jgi:O-antigen/teichoic acid export membrane protein
MNSSHLSAPNTGWRTLLARERVVSHNLIVGGGTMTAGVLGVAFQSLISHRLHPADYGEVFAVLTVVTLIGLPASAFTLLMARESSRDRASGHYASSSALLRGGNRAVLLAGFVLAVILVFLSPVLIRLLAVPGELLMAAAAGIPFALALPLLLGEFQGEQRFLAFAVLSAGQATLKLVGALALGSIWGPLGIIAGVSLAGAIVYFTALAMLRHKMRIRPRLAWWRPAAGYLAVVLPSTLALGVLLSADVLVVKHFFPTSIAGKYAAVAALGRAIFWGASGVAAVLFPKIVFRSAKGQSGLPVVAASLLLVSLGGLAGLGVLSFSSRWLLVAFAGPAYGDAAGYLPWYALGMILLGAAAVLIATLQSRGKAAFLAALIPLTALEPALLLLFHHSLWQVVQVVDVAMALVVGGLGTFYVVQERRQGFTEATVTSGTTTPPTLAQVG